MLPAKAEALLCGPIRIFASRCSIVSLIILKKWRIPGSPLHGSSRKRRSIRVYHRDNLKEVYEKIDRDIEEALPLVSDANYAVPKYHFNRSAAYAFATRFNLYYLKWEKVVEYASEVLGSAPSTVMRDWAAVKQLAWDGSVRTLDYISVGHSFNLLMIPMVTGNGSLLTPGATPARASLTTTTASPRGRPTARTADGRSVGPVEGQLHRKKVYQHPPFIIGRTTMSTRYTCPNGPTSGR